MCSVLSLKEKNSDLKFDGNLLLKRSACLPARLMRDEKEFSDASKVVSPHFSLLSRLSHDKGLIDV
jgi:hypothetical protein